MTATGPGHVAQAVLLLELLERQQLEPNVVSFSSAITALAQSAFGRWSLALHLLRCCDSANVVTYNACIAACGSQWQRALQLLQVGPGEERSVYDVGEEKCLDNEDLPSVQLEPSEVTFAAAVHACAEASEWPHAFQLLKEMEDAGCGSQDIMSFNSAISACEKSSEWHYALQLFQETVLGSRASTSCERWDAATDEW
eukprot:Skav218569  [mRNA]  locus=scaffold2610:132647:138841:+ [translate_table: standard]